MTKTICILGFFIAGLQVALAPNVSGQLFGGSRKAGERFLPYSPPSAEEEKKWGRLLDKKRPLSIAGVEDEQSFAAFVKIRTDNSNYCLALVKQSSRSDRCSLWVLRDDSPFIKEDIHSQTDFRIVGDRLVISKSPLGDDGSILACYDLSTGEELWKTNCRPNVVGGHSGYINLVRLHILKNREIGDLERSAKPPVIVVRGEETGVSYASVVDLKTGKVLANKLYRVGLDLPNKRDVAPIH